MILGTLASSLMCTGFSRFTLLSYLHTQNEMKYCFLSAPVSALKIVNILRCDFCFSDSKNQIFQNNFASLISTQRGSSVTLLQSRGWNTPTSSVPEIETLNTKEEKLASKNGEINLIWLFLIRQVKWSLISMSHKFKLENVYNNWEQLAPLAEALCITKAQKHLPAHFYPASCQCRCF